MPYKLMQTRLPRYWGLKVTRCAFWEEHQLPGIFPAFSNSFFKIICGLMILMNKIDFLKLFIKACVYNDSILVSMSEQIFKAEHKVET